MGKSDIFVITGGGGGIGVACARALGKRGTVLLVDIDPERIKKAASQLLSEGFNVETMASDITKEKDVEALAKKTESLGRFAGLVHTAGLSPTMANWKRIFEVNLIGTARLLEAFLPIAGKGAAAVCFASNSAYMMDSTPEIDAIIDQPLDPDFFSKMEALSPKDDREASNNAYIFSKRGVIRLCARKVPLWNAQEARIISISPGLIDTSMLRREMEASEMTQQMIEMAIQHRPGKPEEIANVIAFLLSEEASYLTGAEILVDGGIIATLKG